MKKPFTFSEYKLLRKMSFNDINRWMISFYAAAYDDGVQDCMKTMKLDIEPEDCEVAIDGQRLYDLISSVKGIGEKRADEIMAKIKEAGVDSSLWED